MTQLHPLTSADFTTMDGGTNVEVTVDVSGMLGFFAENTSPFWLQLVDDAGTVVANLQPFATIQGGWVSSTQTLTIRSMIGTYPSMKISAVPADQYQFDIEFSASAQPVAVTQMAIASAADTTVNFAAGSQVQATITGPVTLANGTQVQATITGPVSISNTVTTDVASMPAMTIAANQQMNIGSVSSITETVNTTGNATIVNDFLPMNGLVKLGTMNMPAGTVLPYQMSMQQSAEFAEFDTLYFIVTGGNYASTITFQGIGILYEGAGGVDLGVTATKLWLKNAANPPLDPAAVFKFQLSDAVPINYILFTYDDGGGTVPPGYTGNGYKVDIYGVRSMVGTAGEPNPVYIPTGHNLSTNAAGLVHSKKLASWAAATLAGGPQYPKYNGALNWNATKRYMYISNSTNVTVTGNYQLMDSVSILNLGGPGTANFSVAANENGWYDITGPLDSLGLNIAQATGATGGTFDVYISEI